MYSILRNISDHKRKRQVTGRLILIERRKRRGKARCWMDLQWKLVSGIHRGNAFTKFLDV